LPDAPSSNSWPRIAVMGAGAVGCYFGGMLARAGAPVTLIGRAAHVEAIERQGLFIDSIHFQEFIRARASSDVAAAREAEMVIFSVKTLDTEDAAARLAPHLAPGAILLSLQNGVDNIERIRRATGIEALPSVVYVAAAMNEPGRVVHRGRGELVLGVPRDSRDPAGENVQIEKVSATFARANVPCRFSENIEGDLWAKLILNCAGNPITALGRASYGQVGAHALSRQLIEAVVAEGISVARAAGIEMPQTDFVATAMKFATGLGDATSSTAQDVLRGKRTEIDSLNGYLVRRGAELGIPTPVNFTLYALLKLLEESFQSRAGAR